MEKLIADEDDEGEEPQLEVAEKGKKGNCISASKPPMSENEHVLFLQHSLERRWCLGLVSADDKQRKEDGEQAATATHHRKHINSLLVLFNQVQRLPSGDMLIVNIT